MNQTISLEEKQAESMEQLFLQILSLSNEELESFLMEEYLQNPILDCDRDREAEIIGSLEQNYEKMGTFRDLYMQFFDEDFDRKGDFSAKEDSRILVESITDQLPDDIFTKEEWKIVPYLIQCLDERGFFTYEPEEIAAVLHCPAEEVAHCLQVLKGLEPAGIFSEDISECLLRQIEKKGIEDELLKETVRRFMPELLQGKISAITRALHISTQKVREYIHQIGTLNPYPLIRDGEEEIRAIIPDILVSREGDSWNIAMNDGWIGEYRCNDYYISMMRSTEDRELKQYFHEKLERAEMIIEAVKRRRKTILDMVEAILKIQEEYFLGGGSLKEMTVEQVAEKLSIPSSTVSRAVRNKYLQFRRPVELKSLFSDFTAAGDGAAAEQP